MINWYKQQTLMLIVACSLWSRQAFSVAANTLASEAISCSNINAAYQEVYSFETENYYINICQLERKFYYHRQSKLNGNNILAPAQTVARGDVFQATVGKITYFVGVDSDRHYSSVMLNNNEIVFEPEIQSSTSTPSLQIAEISSQGKSSTDYQNNQTNDRNLSNASLGLDDSGADSASPLVCAREKSAFHPHLNGWQKLIGKSTISANQYALSNGYNFSYDQENPNLALITTQDGATINLSIASNTEVVEQVCIQSEVAERE